MDICELCNKGEIVNGICEKDLPKEMVYIGTCNNPDCNYEKIKLIYNDETLKKIVKDYEENGSEFIVHGKYDKKYVAKVENDIIKLYPKLDNL